MELTAEQRPVRLIAVGGTIAMRGDRAVPELDAAGLLDGLPELAAAGRVHAETDVDHAAPSLVALAHTKLNELLPRS